MERAEFKSIVEMARIFKRLDPDRAEFFAGFLRGLRRAYHGENFGTEDEHQLWLNCAEGSFRKDLQTGYRAGFFYDHIHIREMSISGLRKVLKLSVEDVGTIAGVSPRTVEGWEQGRPISSSAWLAISRYLFLFKK